MAVQTLGGRFAQCQVDPDLAGVDPQARAEGLDTRRDERGGTRRAERQPDIRGGNDLAREQADRLTDLSAEQHSTNLADHVHDRPTRGRQLAQVDAWWKLGGERGRQPAARVTHLREPAGDPATHGLGDPGRHWIAQCPPDRQGDFDPPVTGPSFGGCRPGG